MKTKLKTYIVAFNYTEHARMEVKATSEAEALEKAEEILDEEGCPSDCDTFHREWEAVEAEVV